MAEWLTLTDLSVLVAALSKGVPLLPELGTECSEGECECLMTDGSDYGPFICLADSPSWTRIGGELLARQLPAVWRVCFPALYYLRIATISTVHLYMAIYLSKQASTYRNCQTASLLPRLLSPSHPATGACDLRGMI